MGQLTIFTPEAPSYPWVLDDDVRAAGRRGLAEARAALQAGRAAARARENRDRSAASRPQAA